MRDSVIRPGSASLELVEGIPLLHPEDTVVEAMFRGWEHQQRGGQQLQPKTIRARIQAVRRFMAYTNEYPWNWTAAHFDEWMTHLVSELRHQVSTIRNYQGAIRAFTGYLVNPAEELSIPVDRRVSGDLRSGLLIAV